MTTPRIFHRCAVAVLVFVAAATPGLAGDPVLGVKGLRFLFGEAELVVTLSKGESLPVPATTTAAYRVTVREVIKAKGKGVASGGQLDVLLLQAADIKSAESLAESVVFLKPIRAEDLDYWCKGPVRPDWLPKAWVVVASNSGVVAATPAINPNRLAQIKSYAKAVEDAKETRNPAPLVAWSARSVEEVPCQFIGRAAVTEATNAARTPGATDDVVRKSIRVLQQTLASPRIDDATKATALTSVRQAAGATEGAKILVEFANQGDNKLAIRKIAVHEAALALSADPIPWDAAKFTKLFEKSPSLSAAVAQAAPRAVPIPKKTYSYAPAPVPQIPGAELNALKAAAARPSESKRDLRLDQVKRAQRYAHSQELASSIEEFAKSDPDEVVRLEAVRALASWDNLDSANRIAVLVKSAAAPAAVKQAGVMALGRMSRDVAAGTLRSLADELPDSKLKAAAAALAKSP